MLQRAMKKALLWTVVASLVAVSVARNALWHDDGGIWQDTIRKSPRKARAFNEYGLHVLNSGNYTEALKIFGSSLDLNPYQPTVYINLGLALEKTNQIDRAIAAYERAINVQPSDPTAYYNLGVLYYTSFKDRDSALRFFLKARDLDPSEPDVHQYLGTIYREMGNAAKAAEEMALSERLR